MVTAPLLNQGVEVDLPPAPAEPLNIQNQESEVVVMSVRKKDGACHLNIGSAQGSIGALQDAGAALWRNSANT